MKTHRFFVGLALAVMTTVMSSALSSQTISLTAQNPTVNETFDGDATTKGLPTGWRIDRNLSAPRIVDKWTSATEAVMYAGSPTDNGSSVNLASNAKNGTYYFVSTTNGTDRAVGGLTTGSVGGSEGTRGISPMVGLTNDHGDGFTITKLTISYDVEKYRNGSNGAGFAVQLYWSTDGETWTSAGDNFRTFYSADSQTVGADALPITSSSITTKELQLTVASGSTVYLAWNISAATGTNCAAAQGLAIDNVVIEATFTDPAEVEPEPVETENAILLSATTPTMSENFDTMFAEGAPTLRLPDSWRLDRRLHNEGDNYWLAPYSAASRDVMYSGGVSLASNASNGSYNFASAPTSTDRAIGGLSTGSGTNGGNSTKCINVMTVLTNGDEELSISSLDISYDIEKYRRGSNSNGFGVQLYTSVDGVNWESAGDDFYTFFSADSSTGGDANVPITTVNVEHVRLPVHVQAGEKLYLAWHIAVGNHVKEASAAQGLAIDNVTISATFVEEGVSEATTITVTPSEVILVPENPERVKVLSLNNSLIDYNDQYMMFNSIAQSMGKTAVWTKHTNLGQPLSYHYSETGANSARSIIAGDYWSHIILQEQSSLPRTDPSTFRANVAAWAEYIRENCPNPNAVIIMPVNWAYDADNWANFTEHNNQLLANYAAVAAEYGITLCPVARAYQMYYDDKGGEATHRLYSDNRHPTAAASYLAACMEYQLIFGESATTIAYTPGLGDYADMAEDMRTYAAKAFDGFINPVDHNAGKVVFDAKVYDQFGQPMSSETVTYTTDGGTMEDNVFILGSTETGDYNVTATAGSIIGRATVKVAKAVEPEPLEADLVVNGYLNLNFKSVHLTGETDAMNRAMGIGAPYTVTLTTAGTVIYQLDYSAASNIVNAPKPQIWKGNFYNMVDEGGGIYSYTFDGTYSPGDEISFSRYVNGAADVSGAIKLVANEPVELGAPASITLTPSASFVMGSTPVAMGLTVRDREGHNLNTYPDVEFTGSTGVTIDGFMATVDNKGTATVTATMSDPSLTATTTLLRATSDGAENLALGAATTADDLVKNNTSLAVDGNVGTQVEWTISSKNEEHFLTVDLGALATVEAIELVWEGASATIYDVNLSRNGEDTDCVYEVTNGAGGAGQTVYKYLYSDDLTAVNTRYVTVNTHTVFEAGWGMKLKEIAVYGKWLGPVSFSISGVSFEHFSDNSVTLHTTINHSGYEEVTGYNVWVIDNGTPSGVGAMYAPRANTDNIVGEVAVPVTAETGDAVNVSLPLTGLQLDNQVHNLAVRVQAVMSDGTKVNATAWTDGDADGSTGNESHKVDTSKIGGVTGIETITATTSTAVYYNLQGVRVDAPESGIYIRRMGDRVEKVIVR